MVRPRINRLELGARARGSGRRAWLGVLMSMACARGPSGGPAQVEAGSVAVVEPIVVQTPESESESEAATELPPVPSLSLVDEDWVRDLEDPKGPLLRIMELEATHADDPAPIRALLGVLEPLMRCYELERARDPNLGRLTLSLRRTAPTDADPLGLTLAEDVARPTRVLACARPILSRVLPRHDRDPHGRYALRFFPQRDEAFPLQLPELDDVVIDREGVCFTRREYPCKPHKRCMGPDWERTRCRHPADRPGVAVRWAFGVASEGRWPRSGVDLAGTDGGLVWRTALDPADAERLGSLHVDEARRHLEGFRSESLPDALWVALEPARIVLADRAGVRVYDRRTGKPGFRYAPSDPEVRRMWFDKGSFVARKGKLRCTGDAGHGAFVTVCGDDLLYFDGHALAVIGYPSPMVAGTETTLHARTSTRSGGPARPKASLRAAGWRVDVVGFVFLE